MASRSAVKRSTDWANTAPRPITIKFRKRKESSKPQTNYHWCLRISYLAPYWVISRNTITCHKYFWCWNWKGLSRNGKVSTIGTYRFHELKLQAVSGHDNKTRHYQLWDEVIFNSNRDPRWYSRGVKETLNSINRDSGIDLFTDTAAILNQFDLRSIIGCPVGMSTFRLYFRALFGIFFLRVFLG